MASCKVGDMCGCGFKNTGMKYGYVWKMFHDLIDKEIGCEECNRHGHEAINGLRDHIRTGVGGKPFDKSKYQTFVNEVLCVNRKFAKNNKIFEGFS